MATLYLGIIIVSIFIIFLNEYQNSNIRVLSTIPIDCQGHYKLRMVLYFLLVALFIISLFIRYYQFSVIVPLITHFRC